MQQRAAHSKGHAFVVRIWWEPGLIRPDGRPLWRGRVQHAASGEYLVFQSLDELLGFLQLHTGELEAGREQPAESEH